MSSKVKGIPVFHPTMEEFTSGFSNYMTNILPFCSEYGLAKIVPPKEWKHFAQPSNWFQNKTKRLIIRTPITQYVDGLKGIFQQTNVVAKAATINEFQKIAEKALQSRHATSDDDIERRFWKNIRFDPPIYGADMQGSLFEEDVEDWNVAKLANQTLLQYLGADVEGVNVPYLYFGMWKAMFAWHTEDMDLFSINYLHYGEPKRWYVIPEAERHRFELFAHSHFGELAMQCKEFLRHKTTMISPSLIRATSITVHTAVQREGEFMITFPGAYHAGFNHGFNCAESVNFALESWISRGLKAKSCLCKADSVTINMEVFLQNYKNFSEKEAEQKDASSETPITTTSELKIPTFTLVDEAPVQSSANVDPQPLSVSLKIPIKGPKKSIKKKKRKKGARKDKLNPDGLSEVKSAKAAQFSSLVPLSGFDDFDLFPRSCLPLSLSVTQTAIFTQ